jgi:hypothetical protein
VKLKKLFILLIILLLNIFFSSKLYSQFWVEQVSGVNVSLNSVINSNWVGAGWTCGNNGTVLRTSNYGTNWLNVSGNGIPNDVTLNTISDCSNYPEYAFVAGKRGDTAIVYRTTNLGTSWQQVFRQLGGKINGIGVGNQIGFMAGNPVGGRWSLWKTTNNGLNWDSSGMYISQDGTETGWNNSFMYSSCIVFGTNNSGVYYSTNSGVSWGFAQTPGLVNITSLDIGSFGGPFFGYVAGLNKIFYTIQQDTLMPGSGNIVGIHKQPLPVDAFNSNHIIATKGDNKIYWLGSGSSSWMLHFTAPAGNYTHIARKLYSNVWAVRDNGGITYCGCVISGINIINSQIPERFSLSQNYPNPFNPVTNIKFDLPKSGFVKMTIYDLLGREITQLANQQMLAGSYSVDWDASNYPSGVYFYKIEIDDPSTSLRVTETKKMVLVK